MKQMHKGRHALLASDCAPPSLCSSPYQPHSRALLPPAAPLPGLLHWPGARMQPQGRRLLAGKARGGSFPARPLRGRGGSGTPAGQGALGRASRGWRGGQGRRRCSQRRQQHQQQAGSECQRKAVQGRGTTGQVAAADGGAGSTAVGGAAGGTGAAAGHCLHRSVQVCK